ncbi:fluoride efflux transporter CrcB [Aurantimonas sp. Leaf443]|uniref:fluoride efflux transporter CrcB n=1 Tax=Aurantimonas sp. Leaf443 TaxID=1736378 RepID=UPI0006F91EAE|nr:fluoride efflux transporter CrcB [Aurantimonas sp. Leaf443]KQT83545.1 camphor resistance protein CrcB [Aurantimonas sp. Leaf443]
MLDLLLVALGGAIGSGARHLTNLATLRLFGPNFPWGTVAVNLLGAFAMGIVVEVVARRFGASAELRLFVATGILGGFTTFSSFALDAAVLYERGEAMLAFLYVSGSVLGGLAALFAGLALARALA